MRQKIKLVVAIFFLFFLFAPAPTVSAADAVCYANGSVVTCPTEGEFDPNRCYEAAGDGGFNEITCPTPPKCFANGSEVPCPSDDASLRDNFCYSASASGGFTQISCPVVAAGSEDETIETSCDEENLNRENCKIVDYIVRAINLLSALAAMAIVGSIIIAGYQYMTARDNASQVQAARTRITWALVALFIFLFMYSFLNWLVPGGVL